jgi:tetratricopeptide (TPR) repeat protein
MRQDTDIHVREIQQTLADLKNATRDQMEALANRFEIEGANDFYIEDLRYLLLKKGEDYRDMKADIDDIPDTMRVLARLRAAAQDAIDRVDLDEVEHLMSMVDTTELEEAAKSAEIRATSALLRGEVEKAYALLNSAANSFEATDPLEQARRGLNYEDIIYQHGLRYGGAGLALSERLMRNAIDAMDSGTELWADAQNNLGNALQSQGTRTDGPASTKLLAQAVKAYQTAQEVYTREDHPLQWAATQNNLAAALEEQGTRTDGAASTELLARAVTAYQDALEVYTREDYPVSWAMTQNNLGGAFAQQGSRTDGAAGEKLLARAVTAHQKALEVYTREDYPVSWATTLYDIAIAQGEHGIDTDSTELLDQSVESCQKALEIYTRDDHPAEWARIQKHLGAVLSHKGRQTDGAAGADLLFQAVEACQNALEVYTRDNHPGDWAMTHLKIAMAERSIRACHACADQRAALSRALAAAEAALTVFKPEHMPGDNHEMASILRDAILADIAALD